MRRQNTRNNFIVKNGVKIVRTPEQIAEIETWKNITDDDIDYSDIPKITHEEFEILHRRLKLPKTVRNF